LICRLGGLGTASKYDPLVYTRKARDNSPGSLAYWLKRVDPDEELPAPERERRAIAAKKAHFLRLAELSVAARRRVA